MGTAPLKELEVLEPLYTTERPSEVNLKLLANFFEVPASKVAKALGISESALSKNPYAGDNSHLKQWQSIFTLLVDIFATADPNLQAQELRIRMQRWLKLSRPEFESKTPLEMMLSGKARKVKNLLEQLS